MSSDYGLYGVLLSALGCLVLSARSEAGQSYELVNYPALQNGYTLSGLIAVADDAASDGELQTDEIVDWRWEADGPTPYAAGFRETPIVDHSPTVAVGIEIDEHGIYLPLDNVSSLRLQEFVRGGRSSTDYTLSWQVFDLQTKFYSLTGTIEGDIGVSAWVQSISSEGTSQRRFLIASAVPEPTTSLLAAMLAAFAATRRSVLRR